MNPYDPEKHVWIIDDQLHVIYKFTYDGKLVMTLGTKGKRGRDGGKLFDRPTDIAWLPDGTFFISDGYGGTRVAKFDKDGKFLMDWGDAAEGSEEPGPERVEHRPQHRRSARTAGCSSSIAATGASRSSTRTASSSTCGRPACARRRTRTSSRPTSTSGSPTAARTGSLKYDLNGKYLYGWGGPGGQPGQFNGPHSITVDQDGNLYLAEVFNGRVQKFRPKPGADPAKVVGQELRYPPSS